jgi:hypothetical protein
MADILRFLKDTTQISHCKYFFVNKLLGNTTVSIAFDDNGIYKYSCDWLYLILCYFNPGNPSPIYHALKSIFIRYKSTKGEFIPGNSVLVSSSFSSGTVHGYFGILEILIALQTQTFDTYIVHQNAQKGIKELIELSIPKEKVLYINGDKLYEFEHLTLIPVRTHATHFSTSHTPYLEQTIHPFLDTLLFKIESPVNESIAVIKSSNSTNTTNVGVFMHNEIVNFCKKNMITHIEPTDYSEDTYARIVHGAKKIVFSWGTAFMKGLLYISDDCQHIDVLVYGKEFHVQYTNISKGSNAFPHKYKQATIKYHLISALSTFIPFDLKEGTLAQAQHSLTQPRSSPNMNPLAIARLFSTRS